MPNWSSALVISVVRNIHLISSNIDAKLTFFSSYLCFGRLWNRKIPKIIKWKPKPHSHSKQHKTNLPSVVVISGTTNETKNSKSQWHWKTKSFDRFFFSTLISNLVNSTVGSSKASLKRRKNCQILRNIAIQLQVAFKYDAPSVVVTSGSGN